MSRCVQTFDWNCVFIILCNNTTYLAMSLGLEGTGLPCITHSCHHHYTHQLPSSRASAIHYTHLDSITCVITSPISVWSPALFPASTLMFVCHDAVHVMFHVCAKLNVQLSVPASFLQLRFLHNQVRAASLSILAGMPACKVGRL
jgi:hypothetical protein